MKDLKAQRATKLLQQLISEGEHENQDFKFTVNDPRKIARTVSAFANHSGGHLLIGIDDNGHIRGVKSEEDIYVVEAAAKSFCTPEVPIEFTAYRGPGGLTVIRADVYPSSSRPVYVLEENNRKMAYFRVSDENILTHPLMLRAWEFIDNPARKSIYNIDCKHTAVLDFLQNGPATPESIAETLPISRATLRDIIIELYGMKLIDFVFLHRKFYINLTKE